MIQKKDRLTEISVNRLSVFIGRLSQGNRIYRGKYGLLQRAKKRWKIFRFWSSRNSKQKAGFAHLHSWRSGESDRDEDDEAASMKLVRM